MATVSIVLAEVNNSDHSAKSQPVPRSVPLAAESITSSGTSQQSTATSANPGQTYWIVTSSGGAVWIKAGANPTAAAGDDWLILDGQTREFSVSVASEKLAVIDV